MDTLTWESIGTDTLLQPLKDIKGSRLLLVFTGRDGDEISNCGCYEQNLLMLKRVCVCVCENISTVSESPWRRSPADIYITFSGLKTHLNCVQSSKPEDDVNEGDLHLL